MADYWDDELEDIEVEDMFVGALLGGAIGTCAWSFPEPQAKILDQSTFVRYNEDRQSATSSRWI